MELGSVGVGLLAGMFSVLSPCVLPLLPLVLAGASAAHRAGPLALAVGVAASFTAVGLFVATIGFSIGLDNEFFRILSALLLATIGVLLLSGALQQRFALASSGLGNAGQRLLRQLSPQGLAGQLVVGLVLGAVWAPCVGPTLGAASLMAARGRDLGAVGAVMLAFGLGAAAPLLVLAGLSRQAMLRWRGPMRGAGRTGRLLLGVVALLVGGMILTGLDHRLETVLVVASPDWLTDLTTRF